jgi:hypothetical protein
MVSETGGALDVAPAPPVVAQAPQTRIERRRAARRPGLAPAALPWIMGVATLVLRLLTAASGPTDWDSAQYASAVGHFDVTHGLPQPPGYWLYVIVGRLIHQVTGLGTIHSLVLVAAGASALAAGLTTAAGTDLGGRLLGVAAGAVVATCPFAWFSGSIVATYSFDMVGCSLLIILAWRARPGSWHGVAAVTALGLLAGFRPSMIQSFAVLALIPVVASTRRWSRLGLTMVAGAAAVGVWLIPLSLSQYGGFSTWLRATRIETDGAAQASSVLDHAAGGATNIGTFAAFTVVALAPVAVLALAAAVALGVRALFERSEGGRDGGRGADGWGERPGDRGGAQELGPGPPGEATAWRRPWYQQRPAVLGAAIVPPMLLVALVQFAKGGYLLAYLPAAVIALLLPVAALIRPKRDGHRAAAAWLIVTSLGVVAVVALGSQRFLGGDGVLPDSLLRSTGTVWLEQPRYQAPYPDTRQAIQSIDAIDVALQGLAPAVRPRRDVVVFDTVDGGATIYRNAGWALPTDRVALIQPHGVLYNQVGGALYYASGSEVAVGPGGSVLLVASPALPGLAALTATGHVPAVPTPHLIGGYRVWRIPAGYSVLGVHVVATAGPRPLGTGI